MSARETGTALLFDVQRFSLHDGPGIRTTLFFKGCNLDCAWCHNPESKRPRPQITYRAERCIDCGLCLPRCPEGALGRERLGRLRWEACTACGACAAACPTAALRIVGRRWSLEELLDLIEADRAFMEASGGGVTLSGGEPLLQRTFLAAFLPRLRARGLHVLLQTAGALPWTWIAPHLPYVQTVYLDVKFGDAAGYGRWTGRGAAGERVFATLRRLAAEDVHLEVRTPLVPGVNDTPEQAEAIARRLAEAGIDQLTLLPYNDWWEAKIAALGPGHAPLGRRTGEERGDALAAACAAAGIRLAYATTGRAQAPAGDPHRACLDNDRASS